MTLYEFNALDLNERMEAVNQMGTFINNYVTADERCNLYALGMFFVEVTYDGGTNSITDIKSFKSGHLLDKYAR
ncbi:hypothetical protein [Tamlana flava]|uniref:hypothetical protein n=1 Tax=Tamlana flava TaxID=3158572 RepID=UPI00351BC39E